MTHRAGPPHLHPSPNPVRYASHLNLHDSTYLKPPPDPQRTPADYLNVKQFRIPPTMRAIDTNHSNHHTHYTTEVGSTHHNLNHHP